MNKTNVLLLLPVPRGRTSTVRVRVRIPRRRCVTDCAALLVALPVCVPNRTKRAGTLAAQWWWPPAERKEYPRQRELYYHRPPARRPPHRHRICFWKIPRGGGERNRRRRPLPKRLFVAKLQFPHFRRGHAHAALKSYSYYREKMRKSLSGGDGDGVLPARKTAFHVVPGAERIMRMAMLPMPGLPG